MTRTARTRSRSLSHVGTYTPTTHGVVSGTPHVSTRNYTCSISDYHGRPVVASALTSTQYKGNGLRLNGQATSLYSSSSVGAGDKFDDFPIGPSTSLTTTPLAAPSGWYLDTVAGTNPSRPVMTPPELLQDLIDIPGQLRSLGNLIRKPKSLMSAKELSSHYLCVQFGWLPLIEDIRQLLDLQSYIIKRSAELNKLYSGSGLRRRLKFADDTAVEAGVSSFPLYGPSNYVDSHYSVTVARKSWATITWKPSTPPPYHPDDSRWNDLSRRIVLGLTVEGMAKGLWNVIPWTWLLGWFTNVGKYTLAYSNTVPATHSEACFMSESVVTYSPGSVTFRNCTSDSACSLSGAFEASTKTRSVSGSLTPGFNVPFLDTFRLSILGALFTQRTMR